MVDMRMAFDSVVDAVVELPENLMTGRIAEILTSPAALEAAGVPFTTGEALYMWTHPHQVPNLVDAMLEARDATKSMDVDEGANNGFYGGHNGPLDGFRHMYLAARLEQKLGADDAYVVLFAHEDSADNNSAEHQMDMHNNMVGLRIAQNNPDASPEELQALVKEEITSGRVQIVAHRYDSERTEVLSLREYAEKIALGEMDIDPAIGDLDKINTILAAPHITEPYSPTEIALAEILSEQMGIQKAEAASMMREDPNLALETTRVALARNELDGYGTGVIEVAQAYVNHSDGAETAMGLNEFTEFNETRIASIETTAPERAGIETIGPTFT